MSEFNVGDLVEVQGGKESVQVRVGGQIWYALMGDMAAWEFELLYTLSLVEAATPALPVEEGVYLSKTGSVWIKENGKPMRFSEDVNRSLIQPENFAPFTRLEPVPVTAKKVLDAVNEWDTEDLSFEEHLAAVGTKFGVES